jgi:nudix-type nucleoside diphosphatase (YffH/AdpP family)
LDLPCFFYGTLCDPDILAVVAGGDTGQDLGPARLPDFAALRVAGEDYPVLVPEPGSAAPGRLAGGLGPVARERIAFFEGLGLYRLVPQRVLGAGGGREALVWMGTGAAGPLDGPWDLARWQAEAKPAFLEAAREYMDHFGGSAPPGPRLWSGIRIRAEARVRAAATEPVRRLRVSFGRDDVHAAPVSRPWAGHFAVEEHRLRFRRFDGSLSAPVLRAALTSGDAVTVLPWDPVHDRVLLVEQWRAGPWARGDRAPWTLEAVAGRCDARESLEATARREAEEEAGLRLGRLERVAGYYPSPGILAEFITSFVGEADLGAAGGLHGLAGEAEDIRAFTVPFDAALAAVAGGEINNSPLVLSLFWLALNRDRLRAAWTGAA